MNNFIPERDTTLFLDIGNSTIKAAYREGLEWKKPSARKLNNASELVEWINSHIGSFRDIMIASVVPNTTRALVKELNTEAYRVLGPDDIPKDLIDYNSPDTLGMDRFFTCYGAIAHTRKSVVVIDSGTACTIDYMTADEIYRGGVIMPGIGILEKAFQNNVPELPWVDRIIPKEWPGKNTKECLQWGLAGMVKKSVEAYLQDYDAAFNEYDLVLTGGAAEWMATIVDRETKVRPMLVFEGMQRYLEFYL